MYLEKSTRPDISCAVHQCARHCANPKIQHTAAVKRIGRYLLGTKDKGLIIRPNQEEESFPFLRHCTAIAKRLRKLRNQEREITRDLRNEFDHEDALRTPAPNFKVGLGHVLSGILAHLSSTVLSATMAWH